MAEGRGAAGLAAVHVALDSPGRGAQLYGAAAAQRESLRMPVLPSDTADFERDLALARDALGDREFEAERTKGGSMSPEDSVALALAEPVDA